MRSKMLWFTPDHSCLLFGKIRPQLKYNGLSILANQKNFPGYFSRRFPYNKGRNIYYGNSANKKLCIQSIIWNATLKPSFTIIYWKLTFHSMAERNIHWNCFKHTRYMLMRLSLQYYGVLLERYLLIRLLQRIILLSKAVLTKSASEFVELYSRFHRK